MLENKVALITGGTRGIGLATARLFAENGAKVIIFGSRPETVEKALADLKSLEVTGFSPNLSNFSEISRTVDEILAKFGKIDILVNNAGISANKPIDLTTTEEFDAIIDLNVCAMFRVSKAVIPSMRQNGSGVILNTSSMVSLYGQPSGIGYPTSKFAVNGFTKSLARELAPANIRVNAVAPGVTNTDMVANLPEEQIAPIAKSIPLGRLGEPLDIAKAFLFLASDDASYITGTILSVDGAARS